ncbi:hypothetical protein Vafri_2548 [Volvox africanus]|uniref:Cilium assembly protein DZIP1 N-terminal domain-containing protein n=1 Tax=Volvox africanus TaxID=51714 RepID=A0A8J4ASH4_9CHLO|nr:hypothetical protein Vafri_2548 [Volvox africanus]
MGELVDAAGGHPPTPNSAADAPHFPPLFAITETKYHHHHPHLHPHPRPHHPHHRYCHHHYHHHKTALASPYHHHHHDPPSPVLVPPLPHHGSHLFLSPPVNPSGLRPHALPLQISETDTRSLLEMYGEVAYADLEKESVYDLTESNLVKMVRVMQLLLQHQQFQLEQGLGVQQQLMEEQVSTLGVLQMIPHLDIKGVGEGLNKLQGAHGMGEKRGGSGGLVWSQDPRASTYPKSPFIVKPRHSKRGAIGNG